MCPVPSGSACKGEPSADSQPAKWEQTAPSHTEEGDEEPKAQSIGFERQSPRRREPQDKASSIQPLYVNLHRRAASSGDRGDTHRYVTCPARGISGSGSTGTYSGSSSESCRSSRTSRTSASCGLFGGRNPAGRWHKGGRGAGGQGDSSVSTCGLGPGWFIIPRSLTEAQLGREGSPGSLGREQSLCPRRAGGERAGQRRSACDTGAGRQRGMEERAAPARPWECLARLGQLTQPCWHLRWGEHGRGTSKLWPVIPGDKHTARC